MYYDFCHFTDDPFAETPDPEFLYFSPSHKAALHALSRGIETHQEVMALFGAPGLGKTTILRACQARPQPHTQVIYIGYPKLSFHEVLALVCQECGLAGATDSVTAMLSHLYHAVQEQRQAGWRIVLLIDEAHQLPVPTLERFLQLLLLQATTGEPLFQLVLAGLPALQNTLNLPALRALKKRLAVTITLAPLTVAESRAYISHRLARVLLPDNELFTPGALRRIIRAARGNPRVLNTLCSNTLITGSLDHQKPVSAAIVQAVIADTAAKSRQPYWWVGVAVASMLLVGGLAWGWQTQWRWSLRARAPSQLTQPLAGLPHGTVADLRGLEVPQPPPHAEAVPEPQRVPEGARVSVPVERHAAESGRPQAPTPLAEPDPPLPRQTEQDMTGRAPPPAVQPQSRHLSRSPGSNTGQENVPRAGAGRGPRVPGVSGPQAIPEHEQAAFTMAGEWTVINTVEETTYPAYKQLRLHFHLVIRQHGDTFEATGEKYQENGQTIPLAARRPITMQGTLTADAGIEATFQESGHSRPTQGRFRLTSRTPNHLTGTFSSTAAGARGTSQWIRRQ